jgi:hypothetical protein
MHGLSLQQVFAYQHHMLPTNHCHLSESHSYIPELEPCQLTDTQNNSSSDNGNLIFKKNNKRKTVEKTER